ncbi:MAG TPA: LptF/LptG family permease [Verrucomicrobiae bacterium]
MEEADVRRLNLPPRGIAEYPVAMRLLDRYLFRELFTPLAYCLGGFLIFWISWNLFNDLDKLQQAKLHLLDIIEYSIAMTPEFLATILPLVLLLALLYTLTNLARHNEITAMRAAGISLWRICLPYFVVGCAAGAVLFVLNEFCMPRSEDWADRILHRYVSKPSASASKEGFQNDQAGRKWIFDRMDFRKGELIHVQVNWMLPDGSSRQLNADHSVYNNGVWTFFNATEYGQYQLAQTNALAMPEFTETPREMKIEAEINGAESLASRKITVPLLDIIEYLRLRPGGNTAWLETQLQEHLAAPFICPIVVLIAIPFGAVSGRRNLFFGVAGSIFICFAYIVIQKVSIAVGMGGHLPGWLAAWSPNFLFAAAGIFLTARVR